MAVTVTLKDGSRHTINGRDGEIIEWWTRNVQELKKYNTIKIEVNCSGPDVRIRPYPDLSVQLPAPRD